MIPSHRIERVMVDEAMQDHGEQSRLAKALLFQE